MRPVFTAPGREHGLTSPVTENTADVVDVVGGR